jgi:hypothetical protein
MLLAKILDLFPLKEAHKNYRNFCSLSSELLSTYVHNQDVHCTCDEQKSGTLRCLKSTYICSILNHQDSVLSNLPNRRNDTGQVDENARAEPGKFLCVKFTVIL